ncbi:MAG: hypothetical protein CMM15_10490 [Rhodospirillaceae bacterium]|nr:hypothetical protein [Rhodospirillaceae bacterium]OUX67995.1 MAG: hypothetical protein CBD38_00825 [bacterium TMED178]
MTTVATSFPWKRIEEKPENFEDVVKLIDSAIAKDTPQDYKVISEDDMCLELFLEKYPKMKRWFGTILFPENKVVKTSTEMIIEKNKRKQIERDLENFTRNTKYEINNQMFKYSVFNYLYILWWCSEIHVNSRKVRPLIILDAIISMNRINRMVTFHNPRYAIGFQNGEAEMNKLVTEDYFELLFNNPKLLVRSSFQSQDNFIQLHKEQRQTLDLIGNALKMDRPLLLGNQMPTGHGKTFLAIPLAKQLSTEMNAEKKKTVLFACSNELVNMDVASNALIGNQLHLWMAKYIFVEKQKKLPDGTVILEKKPQVLIRPYKRCFPATWKSVYRKEDEKKTGTIEEQWRFYVGATRKKPDIIVADLLSCKFLLKAQEALDNPFVGYIDEFVSDKESNKVMAEICHYLPRQTVLLSSILPKFESLPQVVQQFCNRHEGIVSEVVHRVQSAEVSIPCVVVDQDGHVRFPHHLIQTRPELLHLISEMRTNPRIRRTYSPKHVFYWAKDLAPILPKNLQFFYNFPTIGAIHLSGILEYVVRLFEFLCENFDYLETFQKYRPRVMKKISFSKMFTTQSIFYEGKTLYITKDVIEKTRKSANKLFDEERFVKIEKLITERDKKIKGFQKQQRSSERRKPTKADNKEKLINKQETIQQKMAFAEDIENTAVRIPEDFIVNTEEHFRRFHPNVSAKGMPINTNRIVLEDYFFDSFCDIDLYLLMAGIGMYDVKRQTEHQRNLVMKIYNDLSFFCAGLDVVYGTNLAGLINIAIDQEFARDVSIATLYQLMGRVGRIGRSYHANIIANHESTVQKLLCLDENIDIDNDIEKMFQNFSPE